MKKIITVFILTLIIFSCHTDNNEQIEIKEVITVDHYIMLIEETSAKEWAYIQFRDINSSSESIDSWSYTLHIDGFDYEEGHIYHLKIKQITTKYNEDIPDLNLVRYELIQIISVE